MLIKFALVVFDRTRLALNKEEKSTPQSTAQQFTTEDCTYFEDS